jgi:predicted HTH domain antitoxin
MSGQTRGALAPGTHPGKYRVMTGDVKSALLRRHMPRDQRHRHVDVEQHSTAQAMHVVVPLHAAVVPARLIGKRQLLDQSVLGQQMQRPVYRPIRDPRIAPPHPLEDLTRRQVPLRTPDLLQHLRPLGCVAKPLPGHDTNPTFLRMSLTSLAKAYHGSPSHAIPKPTACRHSGTIIQSVALPLSLVAEHQHMTTIHLDLEDDLVTLLRQQDPSIERAARELMVMELYRRGAVSRGKSAQLLGMPLVDFLQRASELGIPYFNYTEEEFAAELAASKRW